jgi:ArsR family transcriptional regulator, arsenate/arsenite/antimonite-responsive transcriptional repressor / arsenate reductase (thioredoxin)
MRNGQCRLSGPARRPRHISDVRHDGDLVITVCDLVRPDPVLAGDPASFDAALAELSRRVERLAPRLTAIS